MTEKDQQAIGMYCRRCGCQHCSVSNTERLKNGSVRRRRTCRNCGYRFVTFELSYADLSLVKRKEFGNPGTTK
jgi:transcriptional regulator NrdR family protein